uniref:Small ribosomal subunit protein uS14 n=1 Tax=Cynoglossus semilaevis TaxID=244447 RepID=A0A3P8UPW0_CYNSE
MGHQQLYWSHPRKFGQGSRSCRVCSNRHGLIRKYGLNMCRQCFRQYAKDIGFVKVCTLTYINFFDAATTNFYQGTVIISISQLLCPKRCSM